MDIMTHICKASDSKPGVRRSTHGHYYAVTFMFVVLLISRKRWTFPGCILAIYVINKVHFRTQFRINTRI